ncbi:hypothetical protein QBC34DRAFT_14283 [Podospora aff. communis PSN243]|uniref:Uncharacterized protein n=1 Tax=Podospora aff. communis PSN243 TaxID=3040156 RepID=A0AAV9H6W8_9PEZI|nr:hypothetical protein QBC34DRAFT_14283 [Podospora aff. communis PSN243]
MASFFDNLYKLFSPLSRSPSPVSTPYPSSFLLAHDDEDMAPHNIGKSLPPSTMDESAVIDAALAGESAVDYFSSAPRSSSMSSTISSQSDIAGSLNTTRARPKLRRDAMTTHFPKPTEEINVAEMLARKPPKHTLSHWFKNGKDVKLPVHTPAQQAKDFEDTKNELLRAKEELLKLPINKRA